eukprot:gene48286-65505_t
MIAMLQAISTTSLTPMVRLSANDPAIIGQALDAGAMGVIWNYAMSGLFVSPLAPHEQAGHSVIPDHTHQRAGSSRQPPDRLLVIDRERHADIGEQADAADQIEQQQAAQNAEPLEPLVAVGEEIVEQEVAGHRQQRAAGLRLRERQVEDFERNEQRGEMHEQADRSDQCEQQKA